MLTNLSDTELENRLKVISEKESVLQATFIEYLIEVDKRKLYLGHGYSSLFSYLNEKLNYSEGSAMRRLKAARLAAKYPVVIDLLKERKINLTNISLIEPVITAKNYNKIIKEVVGKSKREVEEILVEYKAPVSKVSEKITPIVVKPDS